MLSSRPTAEVHGVNLRLRCVMDVCPRLTHTHAQNACDRHTGTRHARPTGSSSPTGMTTSEHAPHARPSSPPPEGLLAPTPCVTSHHLAFDTKLLFWGRVRTSTPSPPHPPTLPCTPSRYTRNLVSCGKKGKYNLMMLCWNLGQHRCVPTCLATPPTPTTNCAA